MNRKEIIILTILWMLLLIGYACAENYPAGGMVPREVPSEQPVIETEIPGFPGKKRLENGGQISVSGPTTCVTGQEYSWKCVDTTATAATNYYGLEMAVLDGTYENPKTSDIQYMPVRSQNRILTYTFYIPGNYVIFMDAYASENSDTALSTAYLRVTVTDGGENEMTRKIRDVVAQFPTQDEFEKALALHDWILDNCVYDGLKIHYSAESLLLHGTGVCNSYTRAYALLLKEAGIDCLRVAGYVDGDPKSGHAWNAVKLDGEWYLIDCTWDDDQRGEFARHAYCAVTDELLENNHTATHYAGVASGPNCSSLKNNWFVRNDRWQEYAGEMFTEYKNLLEIGWHRFSLKVPTVPLVKPREYYQRMWGTVIAYAMSHTTWTYGEGKECTGDFSYDYGTGLITGSHTISGILELPRGLTRVEEDGFANTKANKVIIRSDCEYIGPGAFAEMDLWELAVEADEMEIDKDAFKGIDFVYVIAAEDSTIAMFAREHGWAVGDGK